MQLEYFTALVDQANFILLLDHITAIAEKKLERRKTPAKRYEECPRGVMVKALDYGILVSEFERQSRYYVRCRTNILGKGMNPLIL